MALITCPECNREISDRAKSCPYCGYPINETEEVESTYPVQKNAQKAKRETIIIILLVVLIALVGLLTFVMFSGGSGIFHGKESEAEEQEQKEKNMFAADGHIHGLLWGTNLSQVTETIEKDTGVAPEISDVGSFSQGYDDKFVVEKVSDFGGIPGYEAGIMYSFLNGQLAQVSVMLQPFGEYETGDLHKHFIGKLTEVYGEPTYALYDAIADWYTQDTAIEICYMNDYFDIITFKPN